jgi:hypothetical protein
VEQLPQPKIEMGLPKAQAFKPRSTLREVGRGFFRAHAQMLNTYHFHFYQESPAIMAKLDELTTKVDAINTNLNEQADEVGRVVAILADIRAQLAGGLTADEAAALDVKLDEVVVRSQAVEDSLRSTT